MRMAHISMAWFLAVTCSVSVLLEEHRSMDTMAYFHGPWFLTASFLLSVLPEVFWNVGLFGI